MNMAADFGGGGMKNGRRVEQGEGGRESIGEMVVSYANMPSMAAPVRSFALASQAVLTRSASIGRSSSHVKRLQVMAPLLPWIF